MQPQAVRSPMLGGALAVTGGVVALVGSFLAWFRLTFSRFPQLSRTLAGTKGIDGKIALGCGIVAGVAGLLMVAGPASARRWLAIVTLIAGLVALAVAVLDMAT